MEVVETLKAQFPENLFKTIINTCTRLREASHHGTPIIEYDTRCAGFGDYQDLAKDLSAIEPPLWMALRGAQVMLDGGYIEPQIIDAEIQDWDIPDISNSKVEIFPSGSHPSAYISQREGIKVLALKIASLRKKVKV